MTEDTTPLSPVPDGAAYVSPLTRFVYRDMPRGWALAQACVLKDGTQVLAVQRGLSRQQRREAVRRALARIQAPRRAAFILYGADLARRAAQPVQRGAHLVQQIPGAVRGAASGPALITGALAVGAIGVASGAAVIPGIMDRPAYTGPYVNSPQWHEQHPVYASLPATPLAYLGVYEPTSPGSYAGIEAFAQTCGRQPNLVLYYSGWNEPFQTGFADAAAAHGAIPVVQINPETGIAPYPGSAHAEMPGGAAAGISLAALAAGDYDTYLIEYADQVASFGRPVVLSFAPEVNGNWYPWSAQPAQDYRAAWRHIVDIFRRQGADNVTWMWTVNRLSANASAGLQQWWPGESYVTWVGVDGYYRHPQDNWAGVFGPVVAAVRSFTQAPVLVAETAIGQKGTKPPQMEDMEANIRAEGDLGLVWFDENKGRLAYRLEGDAPAIAMFQRLTRPWQLEHQHKRVAA